jgi:hypothetical protein
MAPDSAAAAAVAPPTPVAPAGGVVAPPHVPPAPATSFGREGSRGWGPTLAVLALIATLTIALPAIDRALPHDKPLATGTEVPVGAATVRSPAGWALDTRAGRPTLVKGAVQIVMEARTGPDSLRSSFDRAAGEIAAAGSWLVSEPEVVTNAHGHRVMVAPATSPNGSGLLAVSVGDDGITGFVLLAKAPGDALSTEHDAVESVLDSLELP